ncbi:hypothetical protein BU14_0074s0033 [Porphyra umbilicalis]|uniref:RING-type E3 ubiquitin transferase n=1 Tax=Porphyra umbilicalis TaxID=2786 RepID=A0A1X6PG06_PORUM|nr:hypothetical protein BU14_0074s0033 [Porphyra umbilicalis]|eukprot:OSX79603.1 hypothetical protein BU14_0074s0033 [Porphyra umbilicalis]
MVAATRRWSGVHTGGGTMAGAAAPVVRRRQRGAAAATTAAAVTAAVVLLVLGGRLTDGLVVDAPARCGGSHRVLPHAGAMFGPAAADGLVLSVPLVALPRPGSGDPAPPPAAPLSRLASLSRPRRLHLPAALRLSAPSLSAPGPAAAAAASAAPVASREGVPPPPLDTDCGSATAPSVAVGRAARPASRLSPGAVAGATLALAGADADAPPPPASAAGGPRSGAPAAAPSVEASLPGDGCGAMDPSPSLAGAAVAIARGGCPFYAKVLAAQAAGAAGVVVINAPAEGNHLANMERAHNESQALPSASGAGAEATAAAAAAPATTAAAAAAAADAPSAADDAGVRIPAVMISAADWASLVPCLGGGVNASFTGEGEATLDVDYGRDALNGALVRGMAAGSSGGGGGGGDGAASAAAPGPSAAKGGAAGDGADAADDAEPSDTAALLPQRAALVAGAAGASAAAASSSSSVPSSSAAACACAAADGGGTDGDGDGDSDDEVCAVCLDAFVAGVLVTPLPCGHVYHAGCISPWLLTSSVCPVCKRVVGGLPPCAWGSAAEYGSVGV